MNAGSAIPGGQSGSPVKEASFLHRGESVDEQAVEDPKDEGGSKSPLGRRVCRRDGRLRVMCNSVQELEHLESFWDGTRKRMSA